MKTVQKINEMRTWLFEKISMKFINSMKIDKEEGSIRNVIIGSTLIKNKGILQTNVLS